MVISSPLKAHAFNLTEEAVDISACTRRPNLNTRRFQLWSLKIKRYTSHGKRFKKLLRRSAYERLHGNVGLRQAFPKVNTFIIIEYQYISHIIEKRTTERLPNLP